MVPTTFPSTLHPLTKQRQLVALFLGSVVGLQRWADYIPVNFGVGTTLTEGSYNNNGFIAMEAISSGVGLVPFKDYVPVFYDAQATDAWQVSTTGFIPYGTSGVSSPPSLELRLAGATALDSRVTFTRASTATYVGSDGLLQTAAVNAPRLVYDPVTLAAQGLLVEEQRTNLLTYSQDFGNAVWSKNSVTVAIDVIAAPDGTQTADKIQETAVTNYFAVVTNPTGSYSTTYTWSCYAKAAERNFVAINFSVAGVIGTWNLTTGVNNITGGTATATNVGNGWWRLAVVFTTPASGSNVLYNVVGPTSTNAGGTYAGVAGYGVYFWGAQLEAGAFATSYIPTTTAQATRAADVATMTGTNFSSWYNQIEGTFVTEFAGSAGWAFQAGEGSNFNNRVAIGAVTSNFVISDAAGTNQAALGSYTGSSATFAKIAGAYKVNDFAVSINGGTVATDTSGSVAAPSSLTLGFRNTATPSGWLNGAIRSITYYPRRLADTELQALTS